MHVLWGEGEKGGGLDEGGCFFAKKKKSNFFSFSFSRKELREAQKVLSL